MPWLRIALATLRAALAAVLLYFCLEDWPALKARAAFAALPDYDFAAEGERLLQAQRHSEALLVLEAGLQQADTLQRARLLALHAEVEAERQDWLRRLREVGHGAWSGQGDSGEALAGALAADLFVFGDVRDLAIQGAQAWRGEPTDEVIVALSAAGLLLTAAPGLDLGAALLKFARKLGALGDAFARQLADLARRALDQGDARPLVAVFEDAASLSRSARPAGAMAILKHLDDAGELRLAARYAEQPGGGFALWLGGRDALRWLKRAGRGGEDLLLRAARKGSPGLRLLEDQGALLLRPHPLLGLVKGIYKGNVQDLMWTAFPRLGEALLGLIGGWLLFELGLLGTRLARRARPPPA